MEHRATAITNTTIEIGRRKAARTSHIISELQQRRVRQETAADCLAQRTVLTEFAKQSAALMHHRFVPAPEALRLRRPQLSRLALPDIGLEPAFQYPRLPAVRRVCSARLNERRWLLRELSQLVRSRPERLGHNGLVVPVDLR